jgi:hypothetical protein
MMKLALICLIVCAPTAVADDKPRAARGPLGLGVIETYDRIEDRMELLAELGPVNDDGLRMKLMSSSAGAAPYATKAVSLYLVSYAKSWEYLTYHPLTILAGETRLRPEIEHSGTVGNGYVLEFMSTRIDVADLEKIAAAKVVDGKLGSTALRITPAQQGAIRRYLACLADPDFVPTAAKPKARRRNNR